MSGFEVQKDRRNWVDAAKGFGIILVMINHRCSIPVYGKYLFASFMPLFFILSGYTFKTEKLKVGIMKKIQRLLIPYAFYGLILVTIKTLAQLIFHKITFESIVIKCIGLLYSRFCLYPLEKKTNYYFFQCDNSPLWFLTAMFLAYLLTLLYYKINTKMRIVLLCGYGLATIILYFSPILLPWSIDTSFIAALFIISGKKMKELNVFSLNKSKNIMIIILCTLCYIFLVNINGKINMSVRIYGELGIWSILLFYIIGIIGTIICSCFFILVERLTITDILAYIGRLSLTILCTHLLCFNIVSNVLRIIIDNQLIITVSVITIEISSVIILSKLYKMFIPRISWVRFL